MKPLPKDRILRTAGARRAGVAPPTITRWIERGLLDGWRVGGRVYVSAGQIDKMLAESQIA